MFILGRRNVVYAPPRRVFSPRACAFQSHIVLPGLSHGTFTSRSGHWLACRLSASPGTDRAGSDSRVTPPTGDRPLLMTSNASPSFSRWKRRNFVLPPRDTIRMPCAGTKPQAKQALMRVAGFRRPGFLQRWRESPAASPAASEPRFLQTPCTVQRPSRQWQGRRS